MAASRLVSASSYNARRSSAAEEGGHAELALMLRDHVGESGLRIASLSEANLKVEL